MRSSVKCVRCGTSYSLEFAHIRDTGLDGKGRGRVQRYYDIKNHLDSYTVFCKTDHGYYDRGEFGDWVPPSLKDLGFYAKGV